MSVRPPFTGLSGRLFHIVEVSASPTRSKRSATAGERPFAADPWYHLFNMVGPACILRPMRKQAS